MKKENENSDLNIKISGPQRVVEEIGKMISSFSKFNTSVSQMKEAIGKFNKLASNFGKGFSDIGKAGSSLSTNNSMVERLKKSIDLTKLKRTFENNKKYLTENTKKMIESMMVDPKFNDSKSRGVISAYIKEQAKYEKDFEKMVISKEKLAKKLAASKKRLADALALTYSNARGTAMAKFNNISLTEKDPQLARMASYYSALEKSSAKEQKLAESIKKKQLLAKIKGDNANRKMISDAGEKNFQAEQKLNKDDVLRKVNAYKLTQQEYWKRQEREYQNQRQKAKDLAAKKKSDDAEKVRTSVFQQIKDANPLKRGTEVEFTADSIGRLKDSATSGMETAYSNIKMIGMGIAAMTAAFAGSLVVIKNWAYEVITITEKLRGYNIALLGSMKTQKDVNNLLKASEEITRDLPVGYEQMIQATKALSLIAPLKPLLRDSEKSKKVLGDVWNIVLGLSQIEPEWGISGAIFSLREALSGDLLSLKRRFEIPVDFVTTNEGKKISEVKNMPEKMLEGLSNFMSQSFGKEALEMTANQFGAVLNKIENLYTKFKGAIGESGIYDYVVADLKKVLAYFEEFGKSASFTTITKSMSDTLISMYDNFKKTMWGTAETIAKIFGRTSESISDGLEGAIDVVQELNYYLKWVANYVSSDAFQNWAVDMSKKTVEAITWLYNKIMGFVRDVSDFASKNINKFYESFMGLVNKVRGIVGDNGLIFMALVGPQNAIGMITATLQTGVGMLAIMLNTLTSFTVVMTALSGTTTGWTIGLGGSLAAMYGIYKVTKANFDLWMKNRNLWQKMGIGLTPEMKAQDKVDSLTSYTRAMNMKFGSAFKSLIGRDLTTNDLGLFSAGGKEMSLASKLSQKLAVMAETGEKVKTDFDYELSASTVKKWVDALIEQRESISQEEFAMAAKAEALDSKAVDLAEENNKIIATISSLADKAGVNTENALNLLKNIANGSSTQAPGIRPQDIQPTITNTTERGDLTKLAQSGVKLDKVLDQTLNTGAKLEDYFKMTLGQTISISSGFREQQYDKNGKPIPSLHNLGRALDFSGSEIMGMSALQQKTINSREWLTELAKILKNSGSTMTFENKKKNEYFKEDYLAPLMAQINQDVGALVLNVATNPNASGPHLHMANRQGKINQSYPVGSGGIPGLPPSSDSSKPVGSAADQVNFYFNENAIKAQIKEYKDYLTGFNSRIMDVRKVISDGDDIAGGIIEDIRKQFQKEGDIKVGYARVDELNASLKNLEQEKKQFSGFYEMMSENITSILDFAPKVINVPEGIFGNTMSQLGSVIGGYVGGATKESPFGKIFDMILEESLVKAKAEVPGAIEFEKSRYQGMIRQLVSGQENVFFKVVPDIQAEIAQGIMKNYATTLPLIFEDENIINEVAKYLNRVNAKVMAGQGMAEALSKSMGNYGPEKILARQAKAYASGDTTGDMVNAIRDSKVSEALLQVESALNGASNSATSAAIAIERTNKETQENISLAKTMETLRPYLGKGNRATRGAGYSKYQELLETEPQSDSFNMGIESSLSNFKNWSEQMFEIGSQLVTDLSSTFESNFFDALTGKFKNFADMFRGLGNAIRDMIMKIIAKMAAVSMTKMVLNLDVNGSMSGGGGTSGFGGILNSIAGSIFSGGGSGGGGIGGMVGNFISGGASKVAGGGVGNFLNPMSMLSNFVTGGAGAAVATKAAGGMKLLGSGGALSKLWGEAKSFMAANPWALPAAAAGLFLSQPGRLFGGTVDKTGPAREQYTAASSSRDAMIKRRSEDAANYYGSGNAGNISNFGFGAINFSTWKSGGGFLGWKGPKELHGGTDASAFNASMTQYYGMLQQAAKDHAMKMRQIDKMKEINEVNGLKEEMAVKTRYMNLLNTDYANAQVANDFVKMDELRDKVQEAQMEVYRLSDDIVQAQINMAKSIKEGLKTASDNFVATLGGLKGTNYTTGNVGQLSSFYKLQQDIIKGQTINSKTMAMFGADPALISGLQQNTPTSNIGNVVKSTTKYYQYGEEGKADLLAALDEYVNNYLKQLRISNIQAQSKVNVADIANNLNNTFISPFVDLYQGLKDTKKMMDTLKGVPAASEEYFQLQLEYSEYQEKVSEQIKAWMNSGLIKRDTKYWTNLINGPLEQLQAILESVAAQVRLKNFKTNIYDVVKGFESNKDFTDVVGMVKGAGGDSSLYSGMIGSASDPWESWYNWSLDMIKTKMANAQKGSEEFYTAQEELFRLMAEKADRQKQNAEDAYDKIEEALGKIEETMKVRIAEESKTSKGDTYFIDVGASRDATKQLEALLAKVNTNDPKARELIEAFRKRIMGIRS